MDKASRVCTVAIRSAGTVVVIDLCGPKANPTKPWPLMVKMYKNKDMADGTDIYRAVDGKVFKVSFFLP